MRDYEGRSIVTRSFIGGTTNLDTSHAQICLCFGFEVFYVYLVFPHYCFHTINKTTEILQKEKKKSDEGIKSMKWLKSLC